MAAETAAPRSGWLGKFVALSLGVPPIAVYAADHDEDDEPDPDDRESR